MASLTAPRYQAHVLFFSSYFPYWCAFKVNLLFLVTRCTLVPSWIQTEYYDERKVEK